MITNIFHVSFFIFCSIYDILLNMNTQIIKINSKQMDRTKLRAAADIIREGGLVAFPTETVYGLGADALSPLASKKIYEAKGRPSDNPLIVHISKFEDLKAIAREVPETAKILADAFWPGPLTMVVNKNDYVPYETTGGMETVAVRMPDHLIALALIEESGCLIAAPSANTSGRPSPTMVAHVAEDMDGKIPMIIDGGAVKIGIESTIIDLTEEIPVVLRPGYITIEMLSKVIGEVKMDPGILASDSAQRPKAPGMKYKHYAPKANLIVVDGERNQVIKKINQLVLKDQSNGRKVGIIGTDDTIKAYKGNRIISIGKREDEDSIARHLYGILREFDEAGVDSIYSESFATPRIGQAIMNRLLKAAGHQVLEV